MTGDPGSGAAVAGGAHTDSANSAPAAAIATVRRLMSGVLLRQRVPALAGAGVPDRRRTFDTL
ncbi:hypothetical protein GCM10009827_091580 [Dactylosporangium maewongense]|uniref:Uncharacterized protein n=1 Tax=Dactylosporangium maewongense TaxID=634393 RepID=A0ABP4N9B1_9ACTN